jgi:DNA-binding transcriptional ArsR family regulator
MNEETAVRRLDALGYQTRLLIFRILVKAGDVRLIVSDIQKDLNIPASTLSHHLTKLARVGLVLQGRRGREVYCSVDCDEMRALIGFLTKECCTVVALEQDAQDAA